MIWRLRDAWELTHFLGWIKHSFFFFDSSKSRERTGPLASAVFGVIK